ncbi:hypothetical protein JKY79_00775 [Candidatus Babeliales bacterium]|nr:hypothetical protein [Candidatus Babeliales bacterium]
MIQKKYILIPLMFFTLCFNGLDAGRKSRKVEYLAENDDQKQFDRMGSGGKIRYLNSVKKELGDVKGMDELFEKDHKKLKKTLKYLATRAKESPEKYIESYNHLLSDLDQSNQDLAKEIRRDAKMGIMIGRESSDFGDEIESLFEERGNNAPQAPPKPMHLKSGASKDNIEDGLEALEDLADDLEFKNGAKIRTQDDWQKFCNAFAALVQRNRNWGKEKYEWDGKDLEKR